MRDLSYSGLAAEKNKGTLDQTSAQHTVKLAYARIIAHIIICADVSQFEYAFGQIGGLT